MKCTYVKGKLIFGKVKLEPVLKRTLIENARRPGIPVYKYKYVDGKSVPQRVGLVKGISFNKTGNTVFFEPTPYDLGNFSTRSQYRFYLFSTNPDLLFNKDPNKSFDIDNIELLIVDQYHRYDI